ncbi:hypothetical protein CMI43_00205 [Candidatus Pacearchaeota archaeon]|nr:hypothetical protein [Candidatus Pacearchaeota archaeon]
MSTGEKEIKSYYLSQEAIKAVIIGSAITRVSKGVFVDNLICRSLLKMDYSKEKKQIYAKKEELRNEIKELDIRLNEIEKAESHQKEVFNFKEDKIKGKINIIKRLIRKNTDKIELQQMINVHSDLIQIPPEELYERAQKEIKEEDEKGIEPKYLDGADIEIR